MLTQGLIIPRSHVSEEMANNKINEANHIGRGS